MVFYASSLERVSGTNLENDTEKITRNKKEDSEDSKEFSIARC